MIINVDSNVAMCGQLVTPMRVELPEESPTLADLLAQLAALCRSMELVRDNKLGDDVRVVLINGKEHYSLDSRLRDGDQVTVVVEIVPLGGG